MPPLLVDKDNYPIANTEPATAVVLGDTYIADDGTVPMVEGTKGIQSRFLTVQPAHAGERAWEGAAAVPPADPDSSVVVT